MRLTPRDLEMFKNLSASELGVQLTDYLNRLLGEVCDSRTWGEKDTKESTQSTAKTIQENIISKIRTQNDMKGVNQNPYES